MTAATSARPPAAANGGEIDILRSFARRIDPSDAGAYNNLGVLYFRKGLTDEAIMAFSRALALDERMRVARRNLEIAYGDTGLVERRLEALEERLRADPTDLEALVQAGIAEKTAGRLDRAHTLLQRAVELDANSSVVHFLLAETLYNRGLSEQAMRSVRRSIELNPENPDAQYLLGFLLGDLGRAEEAADANRRAVMLNPTLVRAQANLSLERYRAADPTPSHGQKTSANAHISLGRALRQKGYFKEALQEYEKAIEGGEANAEVLQAMLELYLLQRDTGAAIATSDRFAREFSPTAKAWNGRGVALQLEGRHAEAEDAYSRALDIDSSYPFAHNNIGVLLWHKDDTKGAINAFRRALQTSAAPVEARLNLALGLFKRKHTELALEAYRQVLNTAPEHPVAWNGIGLIFVELGKHAEARNAFARAIQADPNFAEAHYNLSFTLSNLGDFTAALRETKRALSLDPMYTPQKLALAIELPHEEIRLSVAPPISESNEPVDQVADFHFDPSVIEQLFAQQSTRAEPAGEDPLASFALARDFITKGLYERAQAEIARALARGGDKVLGLVLAGDSFAARGSTAKHSSGIAARSASRKRTPMHDRGRRGRCSPLGAPTKHARSPRRWSTPGVRTSTCCSWRPRHAPQISTNRERVSSCMRLGRAMAATQTFSSASAISTPPSAIPAKLSPHIARASLSTSGRPRRALHWEGCYLAQGTILVRSASSSRCWSSRPITMPRSSSSLDRIGGADAPGARCRESSISFAGTFITSTR